MKYEKVFELLEEVRVCKEAVEAAETNLEAAEEKMMRHLKSEMEGTQTQTEEKIRSQGTGRQSRTRGKDDEGNVIFERFYKSPSYATIAKKRKLGTPQKPGRFSPNRKAGVWLTVKEARLVKEEYMEKLRGRKAPDGSRHSIQEKRDTEERVAKAMEASVESDALKEKYRGRKRNTPTNGAGQPRMSYNEKTNPRPHTLRRETGEMQKWYRSSQYMGAAKALEVGKVGRLSERNVLCKGVWLTEYEVELIKEWKKS